MLTGADHEKITLPLFARILDASAVVCLFVAAFVLISGGFVIRLGILRFASHSLLRPLLIAAGLLAIRHMRVPAPTIFTRAASWTNGLTELSTATLITTALISRVSVLIVGYFAVLTIGFLQTDLRLARDPLLNLPARFDAGWYGDIALDGYKFNEALEGQLNIAFFPAYPMMVRVAGYATGAFEAAVPRNYRMLYTLWAAVAISVLAFVCAALYFAHLARDMVGPSRAFDAVALMAAYPFAVFFSAPYTEAVFLLASVAAFYHFRRTEWAAAAVWGSLAGLTRPNGCLLTMVLACIIIEQRSLDSRNVSGEYQMGKALLIALTPTLGMLAYTVYLFHLTGRWFAWAIAQGAWGRTYGRGISLAPLFDWIRYGQLPTVFAVAPFDTLNAFALVFAIAMLWPVFRLVGLAGGVLILVYLAPPMLAGGVLSMGRLTSTLFPVFLALAVIVPRPFVAPLVTAFAAGQGLIAALFFTWHEIF